MSRKWLRGHIRNELEQYIHAQNVIEGSKKLDHFSISCENQTDADTV